MALPVCQRRGFARLCISVVCSARVLHQRVPPRRARRRELGGSRSRMSANTSVEKYRSMAMAPPFFFFSIETRCLVLFYRSKFI